MYNIDTYMQRLLITDPLTKPVVFSAIKMLNLPSGSQGLDIGCGIGSHTMMMAEVVGSKGHITGIDIEPKFLDYAKRIAEKKGLSKILSFKEGNMNNLIFDDKAFDWAWSANLVGYNPSDPLIPLREMIRVVKPGGTIALFIYSSQMLLPGYPLLEAKLNTTSSGIAPFTSRMRPEFHSLRALGWFRILGLEDAKVQTFVDNVRSPMNDDIRNALEALIQMRWTNVREELSEEDWIEYQRLCRQESPDYILDLSDYYAFFTYTIFYGQVP
jgi:demethylmenaquinone methyltransferase/2-methoxy-6-polyprenyl-1,4-benzoquinol methylase